MAKLFNNIYKKMENKISMNTIMANYIILNLRHIPKLRQNMMRYFAEK